MRNAGPSSSVTIPCQSTRPGTSVRSSSRQHRLSRLACADAAKHISRCLPHSGYSHRMTDNSLEVRGVDRSVIVSALCGFAVSVSGVTLERVVTVGGMIGGVAGISLSALLYAAIIKDAAGGSRYSNLASKLLVHFWFAVTSFLVVFNCALLLFFSRVKPSPTQREVPFPLNI
jgi:hypothetical protein